VISSTANYSIILVPNQPPSSEWLYDDTDTCMIKHLLHCSYDADTPDNVERPVATAGINNSTHSKWLADIGMTRHAIDQQLQDTSHSRANVHRNAGDGRRDGTAIWKIYTQHQSQHDMT